MNLKTIAKKTVEVLWPPLPVLSESWDVDNDPTPVLWYMCLERRIKAQRLFYLSILCSFATALWFPFVVALVILWAYAQMHSSAAKALHEAAKLSGDMTLKRLAEDGGELRAAYRGELRATYRKELAWETLVSTTYHMIKSWFIGSAVPDDRECTFKTTAGEIRKLQNALLDLKANEDGTVDEDVYGKEGRK